MKINSFVKDAVVFALQMLLACVLLAPLALALIVVRVTRNVWAWVRKSVDAVRVSG